MVSVNCRWSSSSSCSSQCGSPRNPENVFRHNILVTSTRFSVCNAPEAPYPDSLGCEADKAIEVTPKSSALLRKEIAVLELEILHMERHLLSLYRTAFEQCLPTLTSCTQPVEHFLTQSPSKKFGDDASSFPKDRANCSSGHRSLADLIGASHMIEVINSPNKLSEQILKCVASLYCKLSHSTKSGYGVWASPQSSGSSSSIFSSKNSQFSDDNSACLEEQKKESLPTEILNLRLDDDKNFKYAMSMLQNFRALVRSLDKIDARNMKREEKVAFWINIHNALVMHAYLAYGCHNRVRSASVLKATYSVGGHCVDPFVIQSSILGIRPHYSTPLLQNLFSPGRKAEVDTARHVYALEYPEPLVHFAMCSGAYTDPQVRVFAADSVFRDLRRAKEEFINGNVFIDKGGKFLVPKIVHHYIKDASIGMDGVVEVIAKGRRGIKSPAKGQRGKCIRWLPEDLKFRYLIHRDLASTGNI